MYRIVLQELSQTLQDFVLHVLLHAQNVPLTIGVQFVLQDTPMKMEDVLTVQIQFVQQIVPTVLLKMNVLYVRMDFI